ncbi:MAG: NAD(P)-dependent oxidoreductase [Thermodesulfobacteriota bacterium]
MHQLRKIGFVGLGNMGWPMASHLTAADFELTVFDLNSDRQRRFLSEFSCNGAGSLSEVGAGNELVVTMLPDGRAVRAAVFGKGQDCLADSMERGAILVDMSSSSPTGTQELGRELAEIGVAMVDAPVSGGVGRAEAGTLAIMAGGDRERIDRCRSVFEVLGSKVFHTGQLGSGHAMKVLNNMLSAAGLIAAAEVLLVGRRFGLDPSVMIDVLNSSTGRNNSTEVKYERFVFSRTFASGFSLDLMVKDLTTAVELARETQTPILFSSLCRELWASARADLGEGLDHTDVVRWFEKISSTTLGTEAE